MAQCMNPLNSGIAVVHSQTFRVLNRQTREVRVCQHKFGKPPSQSCFAYAFITAHNPSMRQLAGLVGLQQLVFSGCMPDKIHIGARMRRALLGIAFWQHIIGRAGHYCAALRCAGPSSSSKCRATAFAIALETMLAEREASITTQRSGSAAAMSRKTLRKAL